MERCGTPAYIAPEILKNEGYQDFAVDIWSAGVVLYAMVYGTVPFRANNMKDLNKLILEGKYILKEDVSSEVRDLLTKVLEKDPKKRLTIPQILCHPWFAEEEEKNCKNKTKYYLYIFLNFLFYSNFIHTGRKRKY